MAKDLEALEHVANKLKVSVEGISASMPTECITPSFVAVDATDPNVVRIYEVSVRCVKHNVTVILSHRKISYVDISEASTRSYGYSIICPLIFHLFVTRNV